MNGISYVRLKNTALIRRTKLMTNENIAKALINVQKNLKPVPRTQENPFAGTKYASLDDIMTVLRPLLVENSLALVQDPVTKKEEDSVSIGINTLLIHSSGEQISFGPLFMILEKGAKMNMAQSAGSVITYAKRYAISAIFGIVTDDDTDGVQRSQQSYEHKQTKKQSQQQSKPAEVTTSKELINRIKDGAKAICKITNNQTNEYYHSVLNDAQKSAGYQQLDKATTKQADKAIQFITAMYHQIEKQQGLDQAKQQAEQQSQVQWGQQ